MDPTGTDLNNLATYGLGLVAWALLIGPVVTIWLAWVETARARLLGFGFVPRQTRSGFWRTCYSVQTLRAATGLVTLSIAQAVVFVVLAMLGLFGISFLVAPIVLVALKEPISLGVWQTSNLAVVLALVPIGVSLIVGAWWLSCSSGQVLSGLARLLLGASPEELDRQLTQSVETARAPADAAHPRFESVH